ELVAMATRVAASILGWGARVGTVEEGKLADLVVVPGPATKPYGALIGATEKDIKLLVVGGIRRFGVPALMDGAGSELETIKIGGQTRKVNVWPTHGPDENGPQLKQLTLQQATDILRDALANLGGASPAAPHALAASPEGWKLALDEVEDTGLEMRTLA